MAPSTHEWHVNMALSNVTPSWHHTLSQSCNHGPPTIGSENPYSSRYLGKKKPNGSVEWFRNDKRINTSMDPLSAIGKNVTN